MFSLLVKLRTWHFLLIAVLCSEVFTFALNSLQSILRWDHASQDLIEIGSIDALVVSVAVTILVMPLIKYSSRILFEKNVLEKEIAERKKIADEKEKLIIELGDALKKVRRLSGLIPICASCKKVRDDKGYWEEVTSYISEHTDALFSHGICPDCENKAHEQEVSGEILPPLTEEETAKERKAGKVASAKTGGKTILVAEDDSAMMKLERICLEALGYIVVTAEDGEDAIAKYMENRDRIQLLILDMIMPKKGGKEAYDEIKKIDPSIKALFVSGVAMDAGNNKALLSENVDFVLKPVSPKELAKKVIEVLDR